MIHLSDWSKSNFIDSIVSRDGIDFCLKDNSSKKLLESYLKFV